MQNSVHWQIDNLPVYYLHTAMDKKYILVSLLIIALAGFIVFAFMRTPQETLLPQSGKIKTTASFYPLYFFAQEIGGKYADVANITPPGVEPHDYEPTAQDMARMEESDLLILNGAGLEPWGENLKRTLDPGRTDIILAGEGLADRRIAKEGTTADDPHIWLSPALAQQIAEKITAGLVAADPGREEYYRARANALKAHLDGLDAEYRAGLRNCTQKNIITSHAAFGYLAAEYGFTQVSVAGINPDAEPSPRQLTDITKFAKVHDIRYIFFESLVSPKLAATLAREIGAETLTLNPLEGLSREEIAQGKNYFTEMRKNLANLQIALQCTP